MFHIENLKLKAQQQIQIHHDKTTVLIVDSLVIKDRVPLILLAQFYCKQTITLSLHNKQHNHQHQHPLAIHMYLRQHKLPHFMSLHPLHTWLTFGSYLRSFLGQPFVDAKAVMHAP